jgi:type II secretory pathway component PulF
MPVYAYQARNHSGAPVNGLLEAFSEEDLLKKLQALSYMPVRVSRTPTRQEPQPRFASIKSHDIVMFNMQLACMTDAGVLLLASLRIIAEQLGNPHLKAVVVNVSRKVSEGSALSEGLALYPRVFSTMYINMVRAGELSGTLNTVLNRLAVYIEQEENLRQKIQAALFYPLILFAAGCAVTALIIIFVIPQFAVIFTKAGVPLPLPTMILYNFGVFCKGYWTVIVLSFFGAGFLVKTWLGTEHGKNQWDRMALKIPYIGRLLKDVYITRFTRTLGILTESGVSILQCLDSVKEVMGNNVYKGIIARTSRGVETGGKISHHLKDKDYFPNDVVSMIATGEETGNLAPMLHKISGFYEITVDYSVRRLTTLIEPFFIVVLGGLVGLIMASMILPLFDMVKTIQR